MLGNVPTNTNTLVGYCISRRQSRRLQAEADY